MHLRGLYQAPPPKSRRDRQVSPGLRYVVVRISRPHNVSSTQAQTALLLQK